MTTSTIWKMLAAALCLSLCAGAAQGATQPAVDAAASAAAAERAGLSVAATAPWLVAHESGTRDGDLEPRYRPEEPEPESAYDGSYLFPMTRGVANSTLHPAAKAPLFVLTLPLDIVLLPVGLIGGFF